MYTLHGERSESRPESGVGTVRRRHVIYAEGYDPRGAEGYYSLFRRACDRFRQEWPVRLTLQPLELDSQDFAHWLVDVQTSRWQVATHYDFLRLERFIRSEMAQPMARQISRSLGWTGDDLVSGTHFRIFRASWRFGLHLLFFQMLLMAWLALPVIVGLTVGRAATGYFGLPALGGIATSLLVALAGLLVLRPVADRWFVIQITSCWAILRRFGRGQATWLDQAVEAGARRLVAVARANETDELVVIGHSFGGVIASALMARALELDPELGRRGPRLELLTLGSVMPAVALHPAAERMRAIVRRLAIEPTLAWVDCQSRRDALAFSDFDPVEGIGVKAGAQRCNPLIWQVPFKEMLTREYYRRVKWHFFRMHYQYVMAGDRPASYDYVLLVGGPLAIDEWAKRHKELTLSTIQNSIFSGERRSPDASVDATADATMRH